MLLFVMEKIRNNHFIITFILLLFIADGFHWNNEVQASILKAEAAPAKCLVQINGQPALKQIGSRWSSDNDTCTLHECILDEHGNPYEKTYTKTCTLNCEDDFELREQPGECCPECVQTKCKYKNEIYNIGDSWRAEDTCTLFECTEMNGSPMISAYKKICPEIKYCPEKDLYKDNCCLKCKSQDGEEEMKSNGDDIYDAIQEMTYKRHPCKRECISGESPKICNYTFVVEWYETLSKACYDCPQNISDCYRPHCIATDGMRRSILVINRMMPGPAIEVCLGDTIMVDVKNRLLGESTTLHWHGLHQKETPYMDGVPHISQCPIQPHSTFRYTFKADHSGTHFWHSHTGMQRGDGSFGALIIRQADDPQAKLYDFDLSEHVMILQDWAHMPGVSMFASHHHSIGSNKPPNILVNGRGRYYPNSTQNQEKVTISSNPPPPLIHTAELSTTTMQIGLNENESGEDITTQIPKDIDIIHSYIDKNMRLQEIPQYETVKVKRSTDNDDDLVKFPLETFRVIKGYRYRFRVINAEFLNCPTAISIDNHTLLVINSDGYDFKPIEVSSLVTYAGERFDFIINADQEIGNYWIRFKGLMDCDERFTSAHQVAILHYDGADNNEPIDRPTYDHDRSGLQLNTLNKGPGHENSLTVTELEALLPDEDWLSKKPDYRFYVYYDFYPKDNPHFHLENVYGFHQITNTIDNKLFTPQLNHISLKFPSIPLMPGRNLIDENQFCNESSLAAKGIDCRKEFCECHHVLQVPLGATVEMILIDEGLTYDANHPFHLHGNAFRVIGMDRIAKNVTVETIKAMDEKGLLKRKLKRAPIKDTITVPDGGYTIIRFKADNPGYWLLHCHIEFHAEIGMALVIKVGSHHEMAPIPENFPTCSDYVPDIHVNDGSGAAVRIWTTRTIVLVFFILAIFVI